MAHKHTHALTHLRIRIRMYMFLLQCLSQLKAGQPAAATTDYRSIASWRNFSWTSLLCAYRDQRTLTCIHYVKDLFIYTHL